MSVPTLKDRTNGRIIKIEDTKFTIGRSLACSLVMDHLAVSRIHCVIEKVMGKWCLSDSSSNFTVLNDILLKKNAPEPLKNGDLIKLTNDVTLEFFSNANEPDTEDSIIYVGEPNKSDAGKQKMKIPSPTMEVIDLVSDNSFVPSLQPQPSTSKALIPPVPAAAPTAAEAQDSAFQEELSCGICTELFIKPVILNCQHSFCAYCINMWKKSKNVCPSCRSRITSETASIVLNNIVEKVVENISDEEKQHRKEIIASREEETQKQQKKTKPKQNNQRPTRTRGRAGQQRPVTGANRGNNLLQFDDYFEISSDELSDLESEFLEDEFDDLDYDDEDDDYYTGVPGRYYGGYGSCYICHMPGHWANGCPTRLL